MATILTCPVCGRTLGKSECLVIAHDAIGSLIVDHMIPADIPINTNSDCDSADSKIAEANRAQNAHVRIDATSSHYTPMRNYCGLAGFSMPTLER